MEQNKYIQRKKKFLRKDTLQMSEAVVLRCFVKNGKIIHRKTAQLPAQLFSYEFGEICRNSYFAEHLRTAAFGNILLKHNDAKKQK